MKNGQSKNQINKELSNSDSSDKKDLNIQFCCECPHCDNCAVEEGEKCGFFGVEREVL